MAGPSALWALWTRLREGLLAVGRHGDQVARRLPQVRALDARLVVAPHASEGGVMPLTHPQKVAIGRDWIVRRKSGDRMAPPPTDLALDVIEAQDSVIRAQAATIADLQHTVHAIAAMDVHARVQ